MIKHTVTISIYNPIDAQRKLETLPVRRLQNMLKLLNRVDNGDTARLAMIDQINAEIDRRKMIETFLIDAPFI